MKLFDLAERWKNLGLTGEKIANFHTEIYISLDILKLHSVKCQKVKNEFGENYARIQEFAIRKMITTKLDLPVIDQGTIQQISNSSL